VQASNDEMAFEVEESDEVSLDGTGFNGGSVYSTEPLQITEFVTSQEEVVEVDGIFYDFLFHDDFACISGQETAAAAIPDVLINAGLADHAYAFSDEDENNENDFFQEPAGKTFLDSLESSVHTPERVVLDCDFVRNDALLEEVSAGPSGVRSIDSPHCVVAHSATDYNLTGEHAAGPSGEQDIATPDRNLLDDNSGSDTPAELSSGEPIKKARPCRRSLHKDFNIKRKEITPRKAALWKEVKELRKKNRELTKKYGTLKNKYKSSLSNINAMLSSLKSKV